VSAPAKRKVLGLCLCCDQPVHAGEERRETIEHATGATPDVLLHQRMCRPQTPTRRCPR
jgi:hypothetical protein